MQVVKMAQVVEVVGSGGREERLSAVDGDEGVVVMAWVDLEAGGEVLSSEAG